MESKQKTRLNRVPKCKEKKTVIAGHAIVDGELVENSYVYKHENREKPSDNYISVSGITEDQFSKLRYPGYVPAEYNKKNSVGVYRKKITSVLAYALSGRAKNNLDQEILAGIDAPFEKYKNISEEVLQKHIEEHGSDSAFDPTQYEDTLKVAAEDMISQLSANYIKWQTVVTYRQYKNAVKTRVAPWAATAVGLVLNTYQARKAA